MSLPLHAPETGHRCSDWRDLPLHDGGRSLIEASAGTGKTWTIAVLYLRLLLERAVSPAQIVVTTFTDPAAQELRERLRARLLQAEALAHVIIDGQGDQSPDSGPVAGSDEAWLRSRWCANAGGSPDTLRRDLTRLRLALAELDLAPITTLHGLCRRVLADFPFESGSTFAPAELVAAEALLQELATDAWRVLAQGDEGDLGAALGVDSRAKLQNQLKAYLAPGVGLWTPEPDAERTRLSPTLAADLRALAERPGLVAKGRSALPKAWRALADRLEGGDAPLTKTTIDHLLKPDLQNQIAPEHVCALREDPLLAQIADAVRLLEYRDAAPRIHAWQAWVARVRAWREARLAEQGRLSFDDLIERVHRALHAGDSTLAERLHATWPVALVDEFQDTDAQQYAILDRIFRAPDGAPRGRLVMIGDPKQAIYRFRGGDIHAYLRAARDSDSHLHLDTNFRSSTALVQAFNEFYLHTGAGLGVAPDTPIRYEPVHASGGRDAASYTVDGVPCTRPLVLHAHSDVAPDAGARRRAALEACANHIVELLSGRHALGDTPLRAGDIAVLLPTNGDVVDLRARLLTRGVPCVGGGKSSVFGSDWARELQVVLHAVAHPRDEAAVRAALATTLGGHDFDALRALRDQPVAWQQVLERFDAWHQCWRRRGVLAVIQAVIADATPRLFARPDRERALTDLRHLGELLQARSEQQPGAEALLGWLRDQRAGDGDEAVDAAGGQQLRLESEANRVQLMTLHASKGLEFNVVLLPLMWRHERSSQDRHPVLNEPLCGQRVAGFGDAARALFDAEGQDERFRVLYVALTRARHACHVYTLPTDRPASARSKNPPSDPVRSPLDALLARAQSQLGARTLQDVSAHIAWSEGWPWPRAEYRDPAAAEASSRLVRNEPPVLPPEIKHSFSTLVKSSRHGLLEEPAAADEAGAEVGAVDGPVDLDEVPSIEEPAHPELLRLGPVRGTEFGNALHAMFEHRQLAVPMHAQRAFILQCLRDAGVRTRDVDEDTWVDDLAARLDASLQASLLPQRDPALSLAALTARAMRAEMEFHFVLGEVDLQRLRATCARLGESALVPRTAPATLRGLMTGKIDLVFEHAGRFHVLDYKGNWLGDRLSDYAPAALPAAMDAHHYRFQALLYTVAVHRYLRQRLPDYRPTLHLGEAIYLFVRAAGLAPGVGVWSHRFDDALVEAVDAALAGDALEVA
ncbi:UvrD-helicase domain-containing protein [Lysobacter olei]